jgi:hypothetical protein
MTPFALDLFRPFEVWQSLLINGTGSDSDEKMQWRHCKSIVQVAPRPKSPSSATSFCADCTNITPPTLHFQKYGIGFLPMRAPDALAIRLFSSHP